MKDEEFPEISYFVAGEQPFDSDDYWSEEVRAYTFDEAIDEAKILSKKYHDVYITKQICYVYQMI